MSDKIKVGQEPIFEGMELSNLANSIEKGLNLSNLSQAISQNITPQQTSGQGDTNTGSGQAKK